MDLRGKRRQFALYAAMCVAVCVAMAMALFPRASPLNPTERDCVGTWSFLSPDDSTRLIVYRFDSRRRAREEHYYLTSATPGIPRRTMLGRWSVPSASQSRSRLTVEPSTGVEGMLDASSAWIGETFGDNQGFASPVLVRFYQIQDTSPEGLRVSASRSGKSGQVEFTMYPGTPGTPGTGAAGIPAAPANPAVNLR